jgi:hypothetical protein
MEFPIVEWQAAPGPDIQRLDVSVLECCASVDASRPIANECLPPSCVHD